ncbi:Telomerase protein component 1 [Sesbania bispinosa]|nr:Telomerase protein component 1 [Sesbania bispinosa]
MELATAKMKLPPGEDEVAAEKLAAEREGLFARGGAVRGGEDGDDEKLSRRRERERTMSC